MTNLTADPFQKSGILPYSADYKEKCFLSWYAHGKPTGATARAFMPEDENGRVVSAELLFQWKKDGRWKDRASQMDVEVQRKVQAKAIEEKVLMLQRHAEMAFKVVKMGYEYLIENGFGSANTALKAFTEGIKIERDSRGLSQAIQKVSELSDEKFDETIAKLLSGLSEDEVAQLSAVADEVVEGEVKELDVEQDDMEDEEEEE